MIKILFGSLDLNVGKMFLPLERRLTLERLRSRNKLSLSFNSSWSGTVSESSSLLRNNWFQKLKNYWNDYSMKFCITYSVNTLI